MSDGIATINASVSHYHMLHKNAWSCIKARDYEQAHAIVQSMIDLADDIPIQNRETAFNKAYELEDVIKKLENRHESN